MQNSSQYFEIIAFRSCLVTLLWAALPFQGNLYALVQALHGALGESRGDTQWKCWCTNRSAWQNWKWQYLDLLLTPVQFPKTWNFCWYFVLITILWVVWFSLWSISLFAYLLQSVLHLFAWDDVGDSQKSWSLHLHSSKWWRLSGCLNTVFLFTYLWWLWQIIFLLFKCLWMLSRGIWFVTLPGTEVRLTGLQFAGSFFLKRGSTCFLTPLKKLSQLLWVFRVLGVATQWYWPVPSALMDIFHQVPHSFCRVCHVCLNAP